MPRSTRCAPSGIELRDDGKRDARFRQQHLDLSPQRGASARGVHLSRALDQPLRKRMQLGRARRKRYAVDARLVDEVLQGGTELTIAENMPQAFAFLAVADP